MSVSSDEEAAVAERIQAGKTNCKMPKNAESLTRDADDGVDGVLRCV